MSSPAINAAGSELQWPERLLACLQEMAAHRTNAVLLTLADIDQLECGRRYPESGLDFAAGHWKAFYHCHEAPSKQADEHGHFHIFTDIGEQAWAHVAGLAIDASGQPLNWVAVNRWVTDGPWLERTRFLHRLDTAAPGEDDSLVGRWLLALLKLCRPGLSDLLVQRDAQLRLHEKDRHRAEVLEDRSIYILATQKLDLQSLLEQQLLRQAGARPGVHDA